jgi:hydrogenase nickel incorporation protein HypB
MCGTCGCSTDEGVRFDGALAVETDHEHPHPHSHEDSRTVLLDVPVLAKNDELADRNREWLAARDVFAVNLMSSPGSGKTTLLERTIREFGDGRPICVIEGDQETRLDAERIRAAGCRVVQVNTGAGCHLDASMFAEGLRRLDPPAASLVLVENVGNLVCPALFDLGEHARVVIASVTEGVDKPLKYPHMFRSADLLILNKIDLLPYVDFDADRFADHARAVNPHIRILHTSATRGDGMSSWSQWLRDYTTDRVK